MQFKFEHKTETPVFELINFTHYQGRFANANNKLNLCKIWLVHLAHPT